jgi:anti-sigma B factor antagonist
MLTCEEREAQEGIYVITLNGEVDLNEGSEKLKHLRIILSGESKTKIILNFRGVDNIDSSGVGELVRLHEKLIELNGGLKLVAVSNGIKDLLSVTNLFVVFDIYDTEYEALVSFGCKSPLSIEYSVVKLINEASKSEMFILSKLIQNTEFHFNHDEIINAWIDFCRENDFLAVPDYQYATIKLVGERDKIERRNIGGVSKVAY